MKSALSIVLSAPLPATIEDHGLIVTAVWASRSSRKSSRAAPYRGRRETVSPPPPRSGPFEIDLIRESETRGFEMSEAIVPSIMGRGTLVDVYPEHLQWRLQVLGLDMTDLTEMVLQFVPDLVEDLA